MQATDSLFHNQRQQTQELILQLEIQRKIIGDIRHDLLNA